jgi:hypothetical protein
MERGDGQNFEFIGGPYDGETLPVPESKEGEIFVVDHHPDSGFPKNEPGSEWSEHRYERQGDTYVYLGPAPPDED